MYSNTLLLILLFIIKIMIVLFVPVLLIIKRNSKDKRIRMISYIEIILLILFIVLSIFVPFFQNVSIKGIKDSITINSDTYVYYSEDLDIINATTFKTNNFKDVYYYNNYKKPLSDKAIICDDKTFYMKNIGNLITSFSIMLSTELERSINPTEILDLANDNGIIDCETGVNKEKLIDLISLTYGVNIKYINPNQIKEYIINDKIIMEEIDYREGNIINLTCNKSYIIIYKNDGNKYRILDPNDHDDDYICPDNTIGSLSQIKGDNNSKEFDISELLSIGKNYIVVEGK